MISSSVFEDSTCSMAAAERADMTEALLRGELSREDYETYLLKIKTEKR
jgi:hypothetical protein